MLPREETERLLSRLCIQLGFCLPPDQRQRLGDNPPVDPTAFTDAVFVAEGLDPETADRHLYRQVRDMVTEAFRRATDAQG